MTLGLWRDRWIMLDRQTDNETQARHLATWPELLIWLQLLLTRNGTDTADLQASSAACRSDHEHDERVRAHRPTYATQTN
eukprot:1158761-Pelagomonas_calceolata.AAC.1